MYVGQYGVQTEPDGLLYMRARYYDPEVGRFISEDPIGMDGGLNLYAYAANNPVMLTDPSGNCPWCFVSRFVNVGFSAAFAPKGEFGFIDAATAFGTGFAGGLVPGLGTAIAARIGSGAVGGGTSNFLSQGINDYRAGREISIDPRQVGVAGLGGAFAAAATLPLGMSVLELFSGGVIGSQFGFASGAVNKVLQGGSSNRVKP